ncbi:hypothetical protein Tco_0269327 [Tanacetum coccineum]
MFLNMDQLDQQLDKEEFQEIGSMAAFKSIEKRALHKMEYDSRVNERLMQTTEEKVDSSKALDASLVVIESNGTESQEHDTSSRSGNDAHVDDADTGPIYDEEPMAEKQTALAISSTKAEYISVGKACQQALWMKQALVDYDIRLDEVPIMCDNKGTIDLSKNPVQHSQTKHIEICYHFLRDNVQKEHISFEKVPSVDNIADILTKPLKRE